MSERERPEIIDLKLILGAGLLAVIANFAFSLDIRKLIGKRDRWTCQDEGCDASFQTGSMVHASHYCHDKSDPNYDTVEAGRIQCVKHHQKYHEDAVGHAQDIGLCEEANQHAITLLKATPRKRRV